MNFEEFGKKVKKIGKDTMEEVQKMNEVRQLNSKISDTKRQISTLYLEVGKKMYEMYKDAPLDGFESEIQTINEKNALIEEMKEQIRIVKGLVLCPCCNMEVGEDERFCSNCGNKMPEVVNSDEVNENAVDVEAVDVTEAETGEEVGETAEKADTSEAEEAQRGETAEKDTETREDTAE